MGILDVRRLTKIILFLAPVTLINLAAIAISEPTFTNIARLAGTTTHIALLALWLVTTKGYALFAKTHGEL